MYQLFYLLGFLPPILYSVGNILDERLIKKAGHNGHMLIVFVSSLLSIFILPLIYFLSDVQNTVLLHKIIMGVSGALTTVSVFTYLKALKGESVFSVAPALQLSPVFSYFLGIVLFGEFVSLSKIIGCFLIILGSFYLTLRVEKKDGKDNFKLHIFILTAASSLSLAISGSMFKFFSLEYDYWTTQFYEYLGILCVGVIIFLISFEIRNKFFNMFLAKDQKKFVLLNLITEVVMVSGDMALNYSVLILPMVVAFAFNAMQPLFLVLIYFILTLFFSKSKAGHHSYVRLERGNIACIATIVAGALLATS